MLEGGGKQAGNGSVINLGREGSEDKRMKEGKREDGYE
jgi:hypothetical protein